MLVPEIRDYFSVDIPEIWWWKPESPEDIYYLLELSIGIKKEAAVDAFYVTIATPEALRARGDCYTVLLGRNKLIVSTYDWSDLLRYLEDVVVSCAATSRQEVMLKLARYFDWEYEENTFRTAPSLTTHIPQSLSTGCRPATTAASRTLPEEALSGVEPETVSR